MLGRSARPEPMSSRVSLEPWSFLLPGAVVGRRSSSSLEAAPAPLVPLDVEAKREVSPFEGPLPAMPFNPDRGAMTGALPSAATTVCVPDEFEPSRERREVFRWLEVADFGVLVTCWPGRCGGGGEWECAVVMISSASLDVHCEEGGDVYFARSSSAFLG